MSFKNATESNADANVISFHAILGFLSTLNVLSIVLNPMLVSAQLCERSYDLSIRIYSVNIALSYMCTNVAQLIKSILSWSTFNTDYIVDGYDCLLYELPIILGYIVSTYSVAFIAIDRLIATRRCQTVRKSLLIKLSVALSILIWPLGAFMYLANFLLPLANEQLPVCLSIFAGNKVFVTFALFTNATMNVAVAVGYRKLVLANKILLGEFQHSQLHISLSGRLQLRRNVVVAECLMPSVFASASLRVVAEAYVIFSMYLSDLSSTAAVLPVGYCNHLIGSLMSVVHPIVVLSKSQILRANLIGRAKRLKTLCSRTVCNDQNENDQKHSDKLPDFVDSYFDDLNHHWTTSFVVAKKQTTSSEQVVSV